MEINFLNIFIFVSLAYLILTPAEKENASSSKASPEPVQFETVRSKKTSPEIPDTGKHSIERLDTLDYLRKYIEQNHQEMALNFSNVFSKVINHYSNILISHEENAEIMYVTDNNSLIIRSDVAFYSLSRNLIIHPYEKKIVAS